MLEETDAQPPLQSDGRPPAFAFGIDGFDAGAQLRPREARRQSPEELRAAGDLLLGGKLDLGEAGLLGHTESLAKQARRVGRIIPKPTDLISVSLGSAVAGQGHAAP